MNEVLSYIESNPHQTVHEIADGLGLDSYGVAILVLGLINSGKVGVSGLSDGLPTLWRKDENSQIS